MIFKYRLTILEANIMADFIIVFASVFKISLYSTDLTYNFHPVSTSRTDPRVNIKHKKTIEEVEHFVDMEKMPITHKWIFIWVSFSRLLSIRAC